MALKTKVLNANLDNLNIKIENLYLGNIETYQEFVNFGTPTGRYSSSSKELFIKIEDKNKSTKKKKYYRYKRLTEILSGKDFYEFTMLSEAHNEKIVVNNIQALNDYLDKEKIKHSKIKKVHHLVDLVDTINNKVQIKRSY